MNKLFQNSNLVKLFILGAVFFDILFVMLHFAYGLEMSLFNLDIEKNIPTLYQGFKLIVISSLIAGAWALTFAKQKTSWLEQIIFLSYWATFVYLGLDELVQIHEGFTELLSRSDIGIINSYRDFFASLGFSSAPWLLFFIPVFAVGVAYLGYLAWYLNNQRTGKVYLLVLAIIAFTLVPTLEYWNTSVLASNYSGGWQNFLLVMEEYLEMSGATLFLAFNLFLLESKLLKSREANSALVLPKT